MPADYTIRRLSQGDIEAVRILDGRILEGDRSVTWDQITARYLDVAGLESLVLPPWGCHVAEFESEIVGFILAERQSPAYGLPEGGRIVAIAVHPDHRRNGVGARMVTALIDDCRTVGLEEVYSVLRDEDERDAEFLAACGFDESRVRLLSRDI
jgi:N-acetylglutamate synthase-like GNAT family acetyltransferase